MRAGQLSHIVDVFRYVEKQSKTGATGREKVRVARLRCALVRQVGYFTVAAYEEDDRANIVFQTWLDTSIKDSDTLFWSNQEFKITLLEYDTRTMKIHCTKINK